MLPQVTIEGRVVADPDLRYSPNGVAVAKMRVVCSSRKKDPDNLDKWIDDKTLWMSVTCFKQLAENVVESLQKGDLVTVVGRINTDEWTTEAGEKRSQVAMIADSVAADLRFRTVPHGAGKTERVTASGGDQWATPEDDSGPPF